MAFLGPLSSSLRAPPFPLWAITRLNFCDTKIVFQISLMAVSTFQPSTTCVIFSVCRLAKKPWVIREFRLQCLQFQFCSALNAQTEVEGAIGTEIMPFSPRAVSTFFCQMAYYTWSRVVVCCVFLQPEPTIRVNALSNFLYVPPERESEIDRKSHMPPPLSRSKCTRH